jgi:nucleotide-binding universal stress UspA family protein
MSQLRERVVLKAHRAGDRAAKVLRRRWPDVEVTVRQGDPRVEIVRFAEETGVDMVAVGARGFGRLRRVLVGSTSLAVARYAPCPVAIVQGRPRPVKRVLVAVDGSAGSRAAIGFLSLFELVREAEVAILHVLPTSVVPGRRRPRASSRGEQADADRRKRRTDADAMLAESAAVLAEARHPAERLISEGDPAREIVSTARSRDVDLVVLGARGLRTLGRLLLGSVSETVLHHVDRPVVIVRER